jgi:hypothetical protein
MDGQTGRQELYNHPRSVFLVSNSTVTIRSELQRTRRDVLSMTLGIDRMISSLTIIQMNQKQPFSSSRPASFRLNYKYIYISFQSVLCVYYLLTSSANKCLGCEKEILFLFFLLARPFRVVTGS